MNSQSQEHLDTWILGKLSLAGLWDFKLGSFFTKSLLLWWTGFCGIDLKASMAQFVYWLILQSPEVSLQLEARSHHLPQKQDQLWLRSVALAAKVTLTEFCVIFVVCLGVGGVCVWRGWGWSLRSLSFFYNLCSLGSHLRMPLKIHFT